MSGRYENPSTGPVGATGATGAAGATGPAWTEVRLATLSLAGTVTNNAGSVAIGARYELTVAGSIATLQFAWTLAGASPETVRVSLWNAANSRLGYVDVVVSASGLQLATLATPISIAAWARFTCSTWETTGSRYCSFTSSSLSWTIPGAMDAGFSAGGNIWVEDMGVNNTAAGGGDTCPTGAWNQGAGNATVSPIVTF